MRYWLRGKRGGLLVFLIIAALVAGGLGWVSVAALRLEAQADLSGRMSTALWRLDSFIWPALAKEDSRPYSHYSAVYAPSLAMLSSGMVCQPGTVLEPSPLLDPDLPDWILLHFQTDEETGWNSPQVLSASLNQRLAKTPMKLPPTETTRHREKVLKDLTQITPQALLARMQPHADQPRAREEALLVAANNPAEQPSGQFTNRGKQTEAYEAIKRAETQSQVLQQGKNVMPNADPNYALGNTMRNGDEWFSRKGALPKPSGQTMVALDAMAPLWLTDHDRPDKLVVARLVQIDQKKICQGMVLDWPKLQGLLLEKVNDLFPAAKLVPVHEVNPLGRERTMTALPVELDPGPAAVELSLTYWTPLRVGLALAWVAALVALLAVGLGGWSLMDLSERRIRFVSAVTHELRTPLTTLRLYLDMLAGGMVKEEEKKTEYLHTLNGEADRLTRLVSNVLDFSRLENQRPRLEKAPFRVGDLLEQLHSHWQGRCRETGKELVLENLMNPDLSLVTDVKLVQQILGNLIDNACKYSRGAEDPHLWVRFTLEKSRRLVVEVEDRGPGVARKERRSIFRPFRRGRAADVTAGGVGLGLALAHQWAGLLGGDLTLQQCKDQAGACFKLEVPVRVA